MKKGAVAGEPKSNVKQEINKIRYYDKKVRKNREKAVPVSDWKGEARMELVESILKNNPCYKAGKRIQVKGLVLHSVGCPQPSAEVFVKRFNSADAKVCVHAFVDADTGKIFWTLPWDYRAWHCGGNANSTHIGVEMCEPSCIKYTGGATITCSDEQKAKETVMRTLQAATELFADLCIRFGLDPLADGVIISHKEGHDRGVASGHGDPDHLFRQLHMDYTMDDFRKAVDAEKKRKAGGKEDTAAPVKQTTESENTAATPVQPIRQAEKIQPGDIVTLFPDAVYYTGAAMPDWVRKDKWIVKSVGGDRAVIGKNVSGSHEINSPVNVKYLKTAGEEAVGNAPAAASAPAEQKSSPEKAAATAPGEMTVSERGVELIAKYEGCRLEAYKCPAGVWTIGYGHTAGVVQGQKLSSGEAAKALLKEDLKKYGGYVNACVRKGLITFPLTQNQFDALTSFCYNCGNGNLQKLVSGRDAATVADKLLAYNKGGGKVLAGLTRRREEERNLFLS